MVPQIVTAEPPKGLDSTASPRLMTLVGSAAGAVRIAPVVGALAEAGIECLAVSSGEGGDRVAAQCEALGLPLYGDLEARRYRQSPDGLVSRILTGLAPELRRCCPQMVLVEGAGTSAVAAAMCASHAEIPVAHLGAGSLLSGASDGGVASGGAGERGRLNRRLLAEFASLHLTFTQRSHRRLRQRLGAADTVVLTGSPRVSVARAEVASWQLDGDGFVEPLTSGSPPRILFHPAEGDSLSDTHLSLLRAIAVRRNGGSLLELSAFLPSLQLRREVSDVMGGAVRFLDPLTYPEWAKLMAGASLLITDDLSRIEDAPVFHTPVLIAAEGADVAEAAAGGGVRSVQQWSSALPDQLENALSAEGWGQVVRDGGVASPFGDRYSALRVAGAIREIIAPDEFAGAEVA